LRSKTHSDEKLSYDDEKPSLTLGRAIGHALLHAVAIKIAGDAADKTRQFKEVFRGEWNYRVNNKLWAADGAASRVKRGFLESTTRRRNKGTFNWWKSDQLVGIPAKEILKRRHYQAVVG